MKPELADIFVVAACGAAAGGAFANGNVALGIVGTLMTILTAVALHYFSRR